MLPNNTLLDKYSYSKLNQGRNNRQLTIPLLLKAFINKSSDVSQTDIENLYASLDLLFSNKDELTLLILENVALDIILHNLKTRFMNALECVGSDCCSGSFSPARGISIVNFPGANDFYNTLIHEFTHAVSCYAFRFVPLPLRPDFTPLFYKEAFAQFISRPILPYPDSGGWEKYKYHNINPAALKFKYCVREDYKYSNTPSDMMVDGISSEKLDNFFPILERLFPNALLENASLEEILPVYMECRVELLRMADVNGFPREHALGILARKLPRIHDYSETDLRKVLKYRLECFEDELHSRGIESEFLKDQTSHSDMIRTVFKKDGTLHMSPTSRKSSFSR